MSGVRFWSYCLALLSLLTSGCVHTVYRDPSFTRPKMEAGKLAIGAVTALGGGDYVAADAVAKVVQRDFQTFRPGLAILPLAEVRKTMDPARYSQRLHHVSEGSGWTSKDFELFGDLTNRVQFILVIDFFARKEAMAASLYQEHYDPGVDGWGGYTYYELDPTATAKGSVKAYFVIYDTRKGKPVWVVKGKSSRGSVRHLSVAQFQEYPTHIGVPSFEDLVEPMARGAARRLP